MKKSNLILIFILLQIAVGCASHHHDRFPSSTDIENEAYYKRNQRLGR
jgi:hypothetical protein